MITSMKNWIHCSLLSILIVQVVFGASFLQACPCGCGSSSPLLLSHGERLKFQLGLQKEFSHAYVDRNSQFSQPKRESIYTLNTSFALKLTDLISVSMTLPFKYDGRPHVKKEGLGEPSLGVRMFALEAMLSPALRAELYALTTVKYPYANALDANGRWELSPAVEAVFHLNQWSVGIFEQVIWRNAKQVNNMRQQFGLINKLSVSAAYTWFGVGQVMLGLEQEVRGQNKLNQEWIENSDRIDHKLRLTANLRVGDQKTISMTYSQLIPLLSNINTMSYNTLGLSYIQAI